MIATTASSIQGVDDANIKTSFARITKDCLATLPADTLHVTCYMTAGDDCNNM